MQRTGFQKTISEILQRKISTLQSIQIYSNILNLNFTIEIIDIKKFKLYMIS